MNCVVVGVGPVKPGLAWSDCGAHAQRCSLSSRRFTMLRRLTRSSWLMSAIALTLMVAGCKNGGGTGY
jgi:hypothetical protein